MPMPYLSAMNALGVFKAQKPAEQGAHEAPVPSLIDPQPKGTAARVACTQEVP